jgi:hypothetical protein
LLFLNDNLSHTFAPWSFNWGELGEMLANLFKDSGQVTRDLESNPDLVNGARALGFVGLLDWIKDHWMLSAAIFLVVVWLGAPGKKT